MSSINPVPADGYIRGAQWGIIAAASLLAITLIATGVLYALNPQGMLATANYPALITMASVGGVAALTLITNAIIFTYYKSKKQQPPAPPIEPLAPPVEPTAPPQPIIPSSPVLVEEPAAPLPPPPQPLPDLPPAPPVTLQELMDLYSAPIKAFEDLLIAFAEAYNKHAKAKEKSDITLLKKGFVSLNTFIKSTLNDRPRLLYFAIRGVFVQFLDYDKMAQYLDKSPAEFFSHLPDMLVTEESEALQFTQEILNIIITHPELGETESFQKTLAAFKIAHQNKALEKFNKASVKEQIELENEYKKALLNLFSPLYDRLYKDKIFDEQQIEKWSTRLIPRFLDIFKEKLFHQKIPEKINMILNGSDPGGIFTGFWGLLIRGALYVSPEKMCEEAKKRIVEFPLEEVDKTTLNSIAEQFIFTLINPVFYAIFSPLFGDPCKVFREKFQAFLKSATAKPPTFANIHNASWNTYVETHVLYLKGLTGYFNTMDKLTIDEYAKFLTKYLNDPEMHKLSVVEYIEYLNDPDLFKKTHPALFKTEEKTDSPSQ